jgi:hypothetical protein
MVIKNQGINIMVLYTTYLPLPTNNFYNTWIAPFASQIPVALQNCASPGLYAEVIPLNVSISTAMAALFTQTITAPSARLVK